MANQHAARALPPGGRSSRGVFTRQLLLAAGWSSDAIESRVHAGRWQRLAAGVYLTHSGPITWEVRANAGLLHGGKSAVLWLDSAAYVDRMLSRPPATVHVLVPPGATGRHMPGVQFHRTRVTRATHGDPLRTMPWVTAIDRAAAADSPDAVIEALAVAVRSGWSQHDVAPPVAQRDLSSAKYHEIVPPGIGVGSTGRVAQLSVELASKCIALVGDITAQRNAAKDLWLLAESPR